MDTLDLQRKKLFELISLFRKLCQQSDQSKSWFWFEIRERSLASAIFETPCRSRQLPAMLSTHFPMQIMQGQIGMTIPVMIDSSMQSDDKSKPSKYARYGTDMESFRDASQALPYVYKFFWMIYRLSPVRTIIIIAVFLIQGFLPALRLRTGGDFIRQVRHVQLSLLTGSYKKEYSRGP